MLTSGLFHIASRIRAELTPGFAVFTSFVFFKVW